MAILALDAEFAFPLAHDGDDLLARHVLGKDFEVGRWRLRRTLAGGSCGRCCRGLGEGRRGGREEENRQETQGAKRHGLSFDEERVS
jgi:hypothetical protein